MLTVGVVRGVTAVRGVTSVLGVRGVTAIGDVAAPSAGLSVVEVLAELAGLGIEFTAHLGAPGGGGKADGAPGTRTFGLNPPLLESLTSLLASIFFIRLLRPA